MRTLKKIIMLVFCIFMIINSKNVALASDNIDEQPDTIIETNKIYNTIPLDDVSEENEINSLFKKGSRPKKWVVYDVKIKNAEWTDTSQKLVVVKAVNGSSVTASATATKSGTWNANVSVSKGTVSAAIGYSATQSFSISGSATGNIPKGYKLATARAYPIYEVRSFKVKLVHSLLPSTIYKKGSGTAKKPIGIDIRFEYKKK